MKTINRTRGKNLFFLLFGLLLGLLSLESPAQYMEFRNVNITATATKNIITGTLFIDWEDYPLTDYVLVHVRCDDEYAPPILNHRMTYVDSEYYRDTWYNYYDFTVELGESRYTTDQYFELQFGLRSIYLLDFGDSFRIPGNTLAGNQSYGGGIAAFPRVANRGETIELRNDVEPYLVSTGSYTWQRRPADSNTWENIATTTSPTLSTTVTESSVFRRVITSGSKTVNSTPTQVTVNVPVSAGSIAPATQTISSGSNAATLTHIGEGITSRQWQLSTNGSTWSNITGATTANYTPVALTNTGTANSFYYYRVQINGTASYSTTATVTVTPQPRAGRITPESHSIVSGMGVGFTHTDYIGVTSRQWQLSMNGTRWENIIGATTANYSTATLINTGTEETVYYYRIQINGQALYSQTATVTVSPQMRPGRVTPAEQTVASGTSIRLTHTDYIHVNLRQWQESSDGINWTNCLGNRDLAISRIMNNTGSENITHYYRVEVNTSGDYSQVAIVTVTPAAITAGSISPASQTIASGTNAAPLTHTGQNVTSRQWQRSINGSAWDNIPGAVNANLSPGILTNTGSNTITYSYRVIVNGSLTSQLATVTVSPAPPVVKAGNVTPASQTILSGANPATLQHIGAENITFRQWQASPDGEHWTDITGQTSSTYTPGTFSNNGSTPVVYYFQVRVDESKISDPAAITVSPAPPTPVTEGVITPAYQTIVSGNTAAVLTHTGSSGVTSRQWQLDTAFGFMDIDGETGVTFSPGNLSTSGKANSTRRYRVKLNNSEIYSSTASITVTPKVINLSLSATENYVAKYLLVEKVGYMDRIFASEVMPTVTYYDGLGRPKQVVEVGASPQGMDVITPIGYDAMGRADARTYLPYTTEDMTGGYRREALTDQPRFYERLFDAADSSRAFAEKIYEASPLNRTLNQHRVGDQYKNRSTAFGYAVNSGNEVLKLIYVNDSQFKSLNYYPSAQLYKNTVTNEDNLVVTTFTDLRGRILLERSADGPTYLDTYYVYDDMDRLRWVISPEGSDKLSSSGTYRESDADILAYSYWYQYDGRGNVIAKRLPGASVSYMVYDSADRLVAVQSGNDRQRGIWIVSRYDALDRLTNQWEVTSGFDRATMQQRYAEYYTGGTKTLLAEYYYDQYPATRINMGYYFEGNMDPDYRMNGLKTHEKVAILDGSGRYVERTFYYNLEKQLIQRAERNHLGGLSYYSVEYDLVGTVLATHEWHDTGTGTGQEIQTRNSYDNRRRLIAAETEFGNQIATTRYDYNELGQLVGKNLGEKSDITMEYNIQGWLTAQNSPNFTMSLDYFNAGKYGGNITRWTWSHPSAEYASERTMQVYDLAYDRFNRLLSGIHSEGYNENIGSYDKNGNIVSLTRHAGTNTVVNDFTYTYNGNQLTGLSGVDETYAYDANGNMTADPRKGLTFSYNFLNLVHEVKTGAEVNARYTYTADGQKLSVTGQNGRGFNYMGSLTIDKAGGGIEAYFGEGMIKGNEITYFEKDHLGSVRVTFNQQGIPTGRNDYYPFGMRHGKGLNNDNVRMRFNGMELQTTGSLGFIDYGFRWYSPEDGRWLGQDRLSEANAFLNPYHYCMGNPVNFIDLYGLDYWHTNDPEQIKQFMRGISGQYGYADISGWNHTTDADFVANLSYNDETRTFWHSSTYMENNTPTVYARSFKNIPGSAFGPSNQGEIAPYKPNIFENFLNFTNDKGLVYRTAGIIIYDVINNASLTIQNFTSIYPRHLTGTYATPAERTKAGISTLSLAAGFAKLPSVGSTVNAGQFNAIYKGTGITAAKNGGAHIIHYNQTIREIPSLLNVYNSMGYGMTAIDYMYNPQYLYAPK